MEFNSVLKKRKSVRSFKDKEVSWKKAIEIIDAATLVPQSGNKNPFKYIIIQNPKTIVKLADLADQLWISEAPLVIVMTSDDSILEKLFGQRGRVYSRQQAGAAIQNMLLKITDLDLSGCWIGAYNDSKVRELLKVPKTSQIEAIIPVGYEKPKKSASRKKKTRELTSFLRWEDYNTSKKQFLKEPSVFRDY